MASKVKGKCHLTKREAQMSKELHALQSASTNQDIMELLKLNPQHSLTVLRYLKNLSEHRDGEEQRLDLNKFSACYNKMQQLPKSWVWQALIKMSMTLDTTTLNQIVALDRDSIFKLFFFGINMERDAKLISRPREECTEMCVARRQALASPLDQVTFQEVKAVRVLMQPDWQESGVFTLLPPMEASGDKAAHKYIEVQTSTPSSSPTFLNTPPSMAPGTWRRTGAGSMLCW